MKNKNDISDPDNYSYSWEKKKKLEKKGRELTYLLRHKPEKANFNMNEFGFVPIWQVCEYLKISIEELGYIVETNNKKRFVCSDDWSLIRAAQGHSISITLTLTPVSPPHKLYHGTTLKLRDIIKKEGIKKMSRHHVHLSGDIQTATSVGMRHAKEVKNLWIIEIPAKLMNFDGYKFYKTENNVWLVDHIPPKYIS